MNCPTDQTPLQISERQGIEIDYCPRCRGVWLDRGELDKLIERTSAELATPRRGRSHDDDDDDDDRDRDRYRDDRYRDDRYRGDDRYRDELERRRKRKPGGFLGEIFDL